MQVLESAFDVKIPDDSAGLAQLARLMVQNRLIDRVDASPAGAEFVRFYSHDLAQAMACIEMQGYSVRDRDANR